MPKKSNIRTAVYSPRMAPFGLKFYESAFQTIPDISFLDGKNIEKKCKTLNGRLPPGCSSVRLQTLGKRVSDDPRHFIFRRRTKNFRRKFLAGGGAGATRKLAGGGAGATRKLAGGDGDRGPTHNISECRAHRGGRIIEGRYKLNSHTPDPKGSVD